jgi:TonB-linked SusC/RagA family outer membrane protein
MTAKIIQKVLLSLSAFFVLSGILPRSSCADSLFRNNKPKVYEDMQPSIGKVTSRPLDAKHNKEAEIFNQVHITGLVKDKLGNPLVGVTVKIKGKSQGTTTDTKGVFSLEVEATDSLEISYIGYKTQIVPVNNQTGIQITLEANTGSLNEVVVIGYGTAKKIDLTGAVSSIDFSSEGMSSRAVPNISTALAGMAPGISVMQSSGLPGGDQASIRIRGVGSLNASQDPLVIIDGNEGDLSMVDPQDVASISVLKDAAAAAIYGSRASNGVILVTTKSGGNTEGKISFNYAGRMSFGKPSKTDDLISYTPDHMALLNLASENDGSGPIWTQDEINTWKEKSKTDPIGYPNTNWWTALMKPNLVMKHHFSASGGNEHIQFYSALSYYSNDGIIPNTGFHSINFRNKLNYNVNKWLKLGDELTIFTSKQKPAKDADILVWWQASTPGTVPKHDGKFGGGQTPNGVENAGNNALWYSEMWRGEIHQNSFTQNVFATVTPFDGLSIQANYYLSRASGDSWRAPNEVPWWDFRTGIPTRTFSSTIQLSTDNNKAISDIYNVFATYSKSVGDHNFKLLVGYNQEYFRNDDVSTTKMNLLSFSTPVLDAASSDPTASGNASESALKSYFGRLNYDYLGKYLFQANLRYDGSSRFAPDKRWGLFPSFSGGWLVSRENFWKSISDKINFFKIRGSWGQLGNNGIGNYEWQNLYSPANTSFNNAIVSGLSYNNIANPDLTWETTNVTNVGMDLGILNNITVGLNYYDKETKNILANIPIPLINGGLTPPRINSAHVSNKGFEADVSYNGKIGNLSISAMANISYNKNKIVKYKGKLIEPHGGQTAWTEGYPIGAFWLLKVDHIVQNQKEVNDLIANGYSFSPSAPGAGDFLYEDTNGDQKIDLNDRVVMGNPIPLYTYGANLALNYKGFDFYIAMYGVAKWDKYLFGTLYSTQRLVNYLDAKSLLKTWTPENPHTNVPKVYLNNTKNDQPSDFFLHSASFLKIKSLQLGYTLPSRIIKTIGLDKVRIYAELENYFTFTSYPGQDPENSQKSYPIIKTITTGLDVSF